LEKEYLTMCINLGGNGGTATKVTGKVGSPEAEAQLPKKEEPRYELPVGDPSAPIGSPANDMFKDYNPQAAQIQLEGLMEGPNPTVVAPTKSSLALSGRRRKLIDSFKYGLSSQVWRRTNIGSSLTTASKNQDALNRKVFSKIVKDYKPGEVRAA